MPICKFCGEEFELSDARRRIGRSYATGAEIKELMGTSWDDD